MDRDREYQSIAARIAGVETGLAPDLLVDAVTLFILLFFLFVYFVL